jgi:hypothetical protein
MFKNKFQELFEEIFPSDGLLGLEEGEDVISNDAKMVKDEHLTPYGWEAFLKMPPADLLYACFRGQSSMELYYHRIKEGKYLHFREKVKSPDGGKIDLKRIYYKIIECLTYMTLANERQTKIVYNEGLLMINGKTRKSFFSDSLKE